MSKWGVYKQSEILLIHHIPCEAGGEILPPHRFSILCPCQPEVEEVNGHYLVAHRDRQRGLDA